MAIVQDWKIRSRAHHCCYTGEPFADGDQFYTCIFIDPESDGYIRRDYAITHWALIRKNLDPAPYSFWKSTYEAPATEEKSDAIEAHSAEATLRRMIDADEPGTENARYILALMLERKKTLRPMDEKEEPSGRKLIFYEHRQTGEVFIVADPQLRLEDVENVQREVAALLGNAMADATPAPDEGSAAEESATPTPETPADPPIPEPAPAAPEPPKAEPRPEPEPAD